jgi:hypothetical protein
MHNLELLTIDEGVWAQKSSSGFPASNRLGEQQALAVK